MKKDFLLRTFSLVLCLGATAFLSHTAHAQQEMGTLSYYPMMEEEVRSNYHEWSVFMQYNSHREQCQHYQEAPAGFVMNGCNLYRLDSQIQSVRSEEPSTTTVLESESLYSTIYFDFDRSNLKTSEREKIRYAAEKIKAHNPAKVTVSSYADRSGAEAYNQALSERRERSVVTELGLHGIHAETLSQKSYGETRLAIQTSDGVKMPENRRAVIDFTR